MIKKIIALCLCLMVSVEAFAFDSDKFYKAVETYSRLSNRADELLKEAKETWKFDAYEKAMDRADEAATVLEKMVNKLRRTKDIEAAKNVVAKFEKESPANEPAAKHTMKLIEYRGKFIESHSVFNMFKRDSDNKHTTRQ